MTIRPTNIKKTLPSARNLVLRAIGQVLVLISPEETTQYVEFYAASPTGFELKTRQAINDTQDLADLDLIPIPKMPNQFLLWTAKFIKKEYAGLMSLKVCELSPSGFKELQTLIDEERIDAMIDTEPFEHTKPELSSNNTINCNDKAYFFSAGKWQETEASPKSTLEEGEFSYTI